MNPESEARYDEEAALRAAQRGDRAAFDRLMTTHHEFILRIADQGLDPQLRRVLDPEDVVQDVKVSAFRGLGSASFESMRDLRAWLKRITLNRLVDLHRRHFCARRDAGAAIPLDQRVGLGSDDRSVHLGEIVPGGDRSPSSIVTGREIAEALEPVFARIHPNYRQVLRLVYVDHLSTEEIRVRTGKTAATLRKTIERALHACRRELEKQGKFVPSGSVPA